MFRILSLVLALGMAAPVASQQQPVTILLQAAETGNPDAQFQLAERYDAGAGIPQNFATAAHWFQAAAEQGNSKAQNRLGKYLRAGLGLERNDVLAAGWLARAAEDGDPRHLVDLAQMYEQGIGVPQDYARTAALYTQASDKGLASAAVSLGVLYQNGTGVAQDFAKARALYLAPAQAGDARAQNNLGLLYTRGNGVAQDYKLAVEWFSKAARNGLATAMTNLGVMYENGFGVEQSDEKAADLYRRRGQNKAQNLEALLEATGFIPDLRLIPPDYTKAALNVLQTGARQGDPVAQFLLAYLLVTGPDARANYPTAAHWFEGAAKAGLPLAMANLGLLYYQGLGVPQDFVTGYMWLTLAATGSPDTLTSLRDALSQKMTPNQINEAQTLATARWQKKYP